MVGQQALLKKHEDPVLSRDETAKRMKVVSKLYTKVSGKKKPKPPKKEKVEEEAKTEEGEDKKTEDEESKPEGDEAKTEDL